MKKDYIIFTDAASDLPPDLIEANEINILPMRFEIEDKSYMHYPDARELEYNNFYEMLRTGAVAKTSLINSSEFIDYFEPILKRDIDILYIAFSSGMSGTFQSSIIAAEELMRIYPERKVYCVDSLCASTGQGMLVYNAVVKKNEGLDINQLKEWVIKNRDYLCHWFTVNDLNYLKRGGRLSASSAIIGTMLSVKPILFVDITGNLVLSGRARGRQNSIVSLVGIMEKFCVNLEEQTIFIGHGDCINDALLLSDLINKKFKVKDIIISNIGPIIGSHTGPDFIGLFFFGSEK